MHLVFILMLSKIYVARAHVLTRRGECREHWALASEAPLGRVPSSRKPLKRQWGGAGVQPRLIQGIRRRDDVGDLFI